MTTKIYSEIIRQRGISIVRLYYLDESEGPNFYVRSAIGINAEVWSDAFARIRDWRKDIKSHHNIPLSQELHASDLLGGRGHIIKIGKKYYGFDKELGVEIFFGGLQLLEKIALALTGGVEIINVSLKKKDYPKADEDSLERILNRINRSISTEPRYAFLLFDEGKEGMITRKYRKALAYNPIPSKYGKWNSGVVKNGSIFPPSILLVLQLLEAQNLIISYNLQTS